MDSLREHQYTLHDLMPLILETLDTGHSVHFSPMGTSMLPMLRQGIDRVTLSPLPEKLCKYDLPLYQRDNGQYVLHRIIQTGETYTCMGDNQFWKESGLRHDQMIAIVTAFYRGKKQYDVHSPVYLLYCRFWHYSRPIRRIWRGSINFLRRHLKDIP